MGDAKKNESKAVALQKGGLFQNMKPETIELIKNTVAKGATNDELKLFLYTAKRTGLDPLTRQIHFIKRGDQMTIQTGIDGYRVIAERTGTLAGIDDPIYDKEGVPRPSKATVTVWRFLSGTRVAFTASARWAEYAPQNPKQGFMWNKMPYLMLGKCAEALALRKAFPNDLTGIYTHEEMQQADSVSAGSAQAVNNCVQQKSKPTPKKIDKKQQVKIMIVKLCHDLEPGLKDSRDYDGFVQSVTGLELSEKNFEDIVSKLEILLQERKESEKNNQS